MIRRVRCIAHIWVISNASLITAEHLTGRDNLEKIGLDKRIIVTCILKKLVMIKLTWFAWFKVRPSKGLSWTRQWNFAFHWRRGNTRVTARLLDSEREPVHHGVNIICRSLEHLCMKCKFKMVENAEIKILKLFDSPRFTYSGIRRHVYYCMFTDVTE